TALHSFPTRRSSDLRPGGNGSSRIILTSSYYASSKRSPDGDTRSTLKSGTGSKYTSALERSTHCSTPWKRKATFKRSGRLRAEEEEKSTRLQLGEKNCSLRGLGLRKSV